MGQWPLLVPGLALIATGTAIRQWAILMLGRFFTACGWVHAQQTVIDHGPYRLGTPPVSLGVSLFKIGSRNRRARRTAATRRRRGRQ